MCGVQGLIRTDLSEEARLGEVCDPLGRHLAFRQAQLHLQHRVGEASDVRAWDGLVGVPVPPGAQQQS